VVVDYCCADAVVAVGIGLCAGGWSCALGAAGGPADDGGHGIIDAAFVVFAVVTVPMMLLLVWVEKQHSHLKSHVAGVLGCC